MWRTARPAVAAGMAAVLMFGTPAMAQQGTNTAPAEETTVEGLPIYSSDGEKVGRVVAAEKADDGSLGTIKAEIEGFLGLGNATVSILSDKFEKQADRIVLVQTADEVRGVPSAGHQSFDAQ